MLVDEGKMDWDDPVTKYLPYFQMNVESDNESAEVTLRDVLSHRTGFTRMGLLFASGQIPREEVLLDATKAEPYVPSREKFYYSNVMYMSAGVAAGKATARDDDALFLAADISRRPGPSAPLRPALPRTACLSLIHI